MQQLLERVDKTTLGRIQLRMRRVLRAPGYFSPSEQATGRCAVGGYRSFQDRAPARRDPGPRVPAYGETGLSRDEVAHGRRIGEIV